MALTSWLYRNHFGKSAKRSLLKAPVLSSERSVAARVVALWCT